MEKIVSAKTSSPSGDLISYMAAFKGLFDNKGDKTAVYQRIGMIGSGYEGAVHPYQNGSGEDICMNDYAFDMLAPLIRSQHYIQSFEKFTGQKADLDMDKCRLETFTNQPYGSLNRYPFYVYPQTVTDLSKPWLFLDTIYKSDKIILNFTQRYRNHLIHYYFLKYHPERLIFAGLPHERDVFCSQWDIDIPLLQVDNFLELAKHIAGCCFFMGNQSFCYQLAEALKVPRILETPPMCPNNIPVGEKAYDFYHQTALEYYFKQCLDNIQ